MHDVSHLRGSQHAMRVRSCLVVRLGVYTVPGTVCGRLSRSRPHMNVLYACTSVVRKDTVLHVPSLRLFPTQ